MANNATTVVQQEEILNAAREFALSNLTSSRLAPFLYKDATTQQTADRSAVGYRPAADD